MPESYVLLCADPLSPRSPDPAFGEEAEIADRLGLRRLLVDHDAVERWPDAGAALQRAPIDGPGLAVYRGWMMSAEAYGRLFTALSKCGVRLLNTPEEYAACHHLPTAHAFVGRWMPQTTWVDRERIGDDAALSRALASFGNAAATVKDWVKSQAAGYWSKACFIPDAADRAAVRRVIGRFVELQGDSLTGGLVFRRYVPLAVATDGAAEEWRCFALDGRILGCWPRFTASTTAEAPPPQLLKAIARALPSRFATVDNTRRLDDGWLLVETGDGQVSGIPAGGAAETVLTSVAAALRSA
ncbi:ATP-grasp domain-containing protein [Inquilinus limosus]|uniref:ATP-grasp domain-containing protein n=1 Tax=Inquilinus limosus TaxID=171674 RepID=UPI0004210715|nr:ATP-grasp domain-containing protein [Inquilinus limosus]